MICGAGPRPAAASQAGLCSSPSAGTTVFPHSAPFRPPIRLPAKPSSPWAAGSITLAAAPPFPDRRPGRSSSRLRSNTERKSGTTSCTRGRSCPIASLSSSLLGRAYRKLPGSLQAATAKRANLLLQRSGQPFWQDESYDRLVRDGDEFRRIQRYIEANPVAALLACRAGGLGGRRRPWACPTRVGTPDIGGKTGGGTPPHFP